MNAVEQTIPLKRPIIPNEVLGILLFIGAEVMMFSGFISAFTIVKSGSMMEWPPPGQPRLPVEATAINTLILLGSGLLLFFGNRVFRQGGEKKKVELLTGITLLMGGIFVAFQGIEWVRLIGFGLTMVSSVYGSFFYLIIGMHGLHALAGLIFLFAVFFKMKKGKASDGSFYAAQAFWYFVVLLWPILYWLVYLT